jgi:beta-galactosidase
MVLVPLCRSAESADRAERIISLESGWRYRVGDITGAEAVEFDDRDWQEARVPHFGHELSDAPPRSTQILWLRRTFTLPKLAENTRVVVQVIQATGIQCWLNGRPAAAPLPDQSTLLGDVTDAARSGENVLVLQTNLPGIQGAVRVHVLPPLNLGATGLQVDIPEWSGGPATVRVSTDVENHSAAPRTLELHATIFDSEGKALGQTPSQSCTLSPGDSQRLTLRSAPIADPPLWSPESPRLCRVVVELKEQGQVRDEREATFGFRWLQFDPDGPFTVNGKPYPVRGVVYVRPPADRFPDRESLWEYEVGLLKGMGVNFVRAARTIEHGFYEVCDREGLFVTAPMHFLNPRPGADEDIEHATAESDIRHTVRELSNHPSLVAWYINGEGKNAPTARAMSRIAQRIRENDPARPVLCCELGWRSPGTVGLVDADIAGQGNYTGWYEGTLEHIGPYMDDYRALLRERYGRPLPVLISNFGAAGDVDLHAASPRRNDYSHDYHTDYHQRYYAEIARRPWLAGGFIFCFRDLNSEQPIPRHTWKGMLDQQDRKKDAYYFYQSRWTTESMVHIAQKGWTARDLWPAGAAREVEVFSNCRRVELFHNGESLGTKSEQDDRFVWDVVVQEGDNSLRAVAIDADATTAPEDMARFTVRFRPPAVEPRLLAQSDQGGSPRPRLVWEEITGVDRYHVYAESEADFAIQQGRLVATTGDNDLSLDHSAEPQYYKVVAASGSVAGPPSFAVGREPGSLQWKFTNSGWLLSSPALADLTGDGQSEIVTGSYNGSVYALRSDGSLLWSFDATDPVLASPVVVSLTPQGPPSVIVNSMKALYVLSHDGELQWRRDGIRQFDRSVRSPSVADLDGDRVPEIIVGSDTGRLMVFDADGELRWQYETASSDNRGLNPTTCVIIDLPQSAGKGLCVATDGGELILLDARGQVIWKRDLGIGDSAVGLPPNPLTPAAGPLHDPAPTTIISGGGVLRALDTSGTLLWERTDLQGFPQISNLFRDGNQQIVLASGRTLYVLDHRGRDIWEYQLPHPRDYFLQPPASADLNADGEPDLVVGTRATHVVAISSRGEPLWNFTTEDEVTGSPAIADINGDRIVDVVIGSRDGSLYVVNGGESPPDAQQSLTHRGDIARTAAYVPRRTSIFGPIESPAVARFHQDVAYGPDPLQTVDAYLPEAGGPTPVIVEFHGGGWRRGSKRQNGSYRGLLEKALASGISVVSANYRLTPRAVWPAQAEDAVRVVQFVRSQADEWNIDPERVVLIGGSAGAHLSLWVGLHDDLADPDSSDPVARQSSRVSGVIDCWGPTDLTRMEMAGRAREALPQLFGCAPDEWDSPRIEALVREASPLTYVSADDPPVLMIHTDGEMQLPDDPDWKTANAHSALFGLVLKERMETVGGHAEMIFEPLGDDPPQWVDRAYGFVQHVFQ